MSLNTNMNPTEMPHLCEQVGGKWRHKDPGHCAHVALLLQAVSVPNITEETLGEIQIRAKIIGWPDAARLGQDLTSFLGVETNVLEESRVVWFVRHNAFELYGPTYSGCDARLRDILGLVQLLNEKLQYLDHTGHEALCTKEFENRIQSTQDHHGSVRHDGGAAPLDFGHLILSTLNLPEKFFEKLEPDE